MAHVLIVGGGLSGCTAALELANNHHRVAIIEKGVEIGGKVRYCGCKATEKCNNCGVCLPGGLWEAVENNCSIDIITGSELLDITGTRGDYTATVKWHGELKFISGITCIIVSIGFERSSAASFGNLEFTEDTNIISGYQLEKYISNRSRKSIMPEAPARIAFIQCFGSRDVQERAFYCSRVCCGYSTRSAKVLKHYYPGLQASFFYMDLQYVEDSQYYDVLTGEGFEFVRCRPVKIKPGKPARVVFEQPETAKVVEREFDLVVLSEGIHPAADTEHIAELCTLGVDDRGFLKYVREGFETGIYITGCAAGPRRIEEVYNESLAVARQLLCDFAQSSVFKAQGAENIVKAYKQMFKWRDKERFVL